MNENNNTPIAFNEASNSNAKIKVVGVGGCGGNVVKYLRPRKPNGIDYLAINTDEQALSQQDEHVECLQIGRDITKGLGSGAKPEMAADAALKEEARLREMMEGYDMIFIAAGMGKGTGTGASPIVARIAKELGVLVVAIVTRPFAWENRGADADKGVQALAQHVNSLIVLPNDKLMDVLGEDASPKVALAAANEVLYNAVYGIFGIINGTGEMNVDFNDVRAVMEVRGKSVIGSAKAIGENRAKDAVMNALNSPLMEDIDLSTAEKVLINVTANPDSLKMREFNAINEMVDQYVPNCGNSSRFNGFVYDEDMGDELHVTIIVTGLRDETQVDNKTLSRVVNITDPSLMSGRKRHQVSQMKDKFDGNEKKVPAVLRQQVS